MSKTRKVVKALLYGTGIAGIGYGTYRTALKPDGHFDINNIGAARFGRAAFAVKFISLFFGYTMFIIWLSGQEWQFLDKIMIVENAIIFTPRSSVFLFKLYHLSPHSLLLSSLPCISLSLSLSLHSVSSFKFLLSSFFFFSTLLSFILPF